MEPTRQTVYAIMSSRRAAHLERCAPNSSFNGAVRTPALASRLIARSDTPFHVCPPGQVEKQLGLGSDSIVDKWVKGLPGGAKTTVVSLLGRKPGGLSEFSFYSSSGASETPEERGKRPLFQDWLSQRHRDRGIEVVEHPTTDFKLLARELFKTVSRQIDLLLTSGRTVVFVDSGGVTRTSQVCRHAGLVEDSRS